MKHYTFRKMMCTAVTASLVFGLAAVPAIAGEESANGESAAETAEAVEDDGTSEELQMATVGKLRYYYANTAGDDENLIYRATVKTKKDTNVYDFTKADLTQLGDTDYYYTVMEGVTPYTGTLYGYANGTEKTYAEIYGELDAETDSSYDVISSATEFSSHHAGDIPSVVAYGTDDNGAKVITGVVLGRDVVTVDADTYVAASILNAAGEELTEEQAAALATVLKAEPMTAPSEAIVAPQIGTASYVTDEKALEYGLCEFDICPDDSVEGYVWNEYLDSIYAVTVSDGTTTVGAVHWIDIYGEASADPEGYHYNKIQISLNNGTSPAKNAAEVTRYAAFFDENNTLKAGTYTICVYAEGYDVLEAVVEVE